MHRPRPLLAMLRPANLPLLLAAALAGAGALGAAAPAARAEAPVIYKWVDENGVAHYTTDRERIPAAIRDRIVEGGSAARGSDWLRRDATPGAAPAPPGLPSAALPVPPVAPAARGEAEDVERPEESDGVHAVRADPDWSEAPGAEATWAPGDLGEDGQPPPAPEATDPPPVETAAPPPVDVPAEPVPTDTAARPAPPPPPPPLEADGAPVTAASAPPALPEPPPLPVEAPSRETLVEEPAGQAAEPEAPAAVAAPAPRHLPPDEQAELAALDAEIAEVEARIAQDEEALMVLISETDEAPRSALVDDPRFRDIAQRLPKLQADLERLRERRAQIQPAVSRP